MNDTAESSTTGGAVDADVLVRRGDRVVLLTVVWVCATLATGWMPLLSDLGDPKVPGWLAAILSVVLVCGAVAWWFRIGWMALSAKTRCVALCVGACGAGWGVALCAAIQLSSPAAAQWSGLDEPGIGYLFVGAILPLLVFVPAAIIAAVGHIVHALRAPE